MARFAIERLVAWKWLCKDKVRFWIFVGPAVSAACLAAFVVDPPGSPIREYSYLLPIVAILGHACPNAVFTRTPLLLFWMWLITAGLSLMALAATCAESLVG